MCGPAGLMWMPLWGWEGMPQPWPGNWAVQAILSASTGPSVRGVGGGKVPDTERIAGRADAAMGAPRGTILRHEPLHRGREPGWIAGRLWGQLDAAGLRAQRI